MFAWLLQPQQAALAKKLSESVITEGGGTTNAAPDDADGPKAKKARKVSTDDALTMVAKLLN
eukprot:12938426-Prorocentrum_lima.AAC.1